MVATMSSNKGCPSVEFLFQQLKVSGMSIVMLGHKSGVNAKTIGKWKISNSPNLSNIEACLNVVGFELKPVRIKDGS